MITGREFDARPCTAGLVLGRVTVYGRINHLGMNIEQHVYTVHRLLQQHAIFDMRSGSLKSGYRFVRTIYRLPDIV